MKAIFLLGCVLALTEPASVCRAQGDVAAAGLDRLEALVGGQAKPAAAGVALTLEEAERIALEENPEIRLAVRKVRSAESHVGGAGALDDPQVMVRNWGVPLSRPWDYNAAQNMVMYGQTLPGPGKRGLRTAVAQSDTTVTKADLEAVRLRVRVAVRQAFYDVLRAQEEVRIHDQHVGVAQQAIEAARIKYTVGKIPQVEVLKAQLAMTRLAEHMARFQEDGAVAQARLNTLMGRRADAAIEVAGENEALRALPVLETLEALAMEHRPDLMQVRAEADKSRSEQTLAKRTYVPDFSVAAGYMLMPSGSDARNTYAVEGSMSLPWLNRRKHDSELAEAAATIHEKDAELDAMQNAARGEIAVALVRAQTAQRLERLYRETLRKQAEETLHAAVIAYENDQTSFLDLLDSQMAVVDIDQAWVDAAAELNSRMAELEMATGAPVTGAAAEEKKP